jgi:hypothetical protein
VAERDLAIRLSHSHSRRRPSRSFEAEARYLANIGEAIAADVDDIIEKFPDNAVGAAKAYVSKIGYHIPDPTIVGAVRRLAVSKFRLCGIEVSYDSAE